MQSTLSANKFESRPRAIPIEAVQHSVPRSITLHLLPGALVSLFFVLAGPIMEHWGAPAFLAIILGIGLILIPFELGWLLYEARKRNGTFSLEGIVLYREPMARGKYLALIVPGTVWILFVYLVLARPVDQFFIDRFFAWVPAWVITGWSSNPDSYAKPILIFAAGLALVLNGIIAPIVEELYFRGYLLPRLSYLGLWGPLLCGVLFSLYHFFTPWENLIRLMVVLPLVYLVTWTRNIYWGMIVHVANNLVAMVLLLLMVLNLS